MCIDEIDKCKTHEKNVLTPSAPVRRKKLWQLDAHFHCSVIGTCVSLDELRRICQKIKINVDISVSDYELHRGFVSLADEPCDATRLLNKHLDRKYQRAIETTAKVNKTIGAPMGISVVAVSFTWAVDIPNAVNSVP